MAARSSNAACQSSSSQPYRLLKARKSWKGSDGEPTKLTEPTAPSVVKILETPSDGADKTSAGSVLSVLSVRSPGVFALSRSWFSHLPMDQPSTFRLGFHTYEI